ncbi:MAG TPA: hypothetical protein VGH02_00220 [Rhizomicrobium sp.]|jgi:hypothetical protein
MFRAVFLALLTVLALGSAPAIAQPRRSPDVQPLDRVLPQVRRHYPGTFYDADGPFPDEQGSPHYRLKWMTPEGRVIWLDTDARTGRVLGVEHGAPRGSYTMPPPGMRAPPPGYFEGPPRGQFGAGYPDREYRDNRGWNNGRGRQNDRGWHGGEGRGDWGGGHGGGHRHGHGG